jgi:hypothetical protein
VSHPLTRPAGTAAAVLTIALALVLNTGTVSSAQIRRAQSWIPAPCATGQFTAVETTADRQTAIHGHVTACEPYGSRSRFALVAFHPQRYFALAYPSSLLEYQPEGFSPVSGVFRSVPTAREAGVCAMRTLTDRIACVRVTFPTDGPATMEPIPTTDPLVNKAVFYVDEQGPTPVPPPGGFCGSCLDLPPA